MMGKCFSNKIAALFTSIQGPAVEISFRNNRLGFRIWVEGELETVGWAPRGAVGCLVDP